MSDTGNSATLTFATTGLSANIINMGELPIELPKLNDSHLGSSGFEEYLPGDLDDPGEFEIEIEFDTGTATPARGTAETITLTYPQRSGETTPADLAGSGFIRRYTYPQLANNTIQRAKVLVAFDGKTGPTFTPGS